MDTRPLQSYDSVDPALDPSIEYQGIFNSTGLFIYPISLKDMAIAIKEMEHQSLNYLEISAAKLEISSCNKKIEEKNILHYSDEDHRLLPVSERRRVDLERLEVNKQLLECYNRIVSANKRLSQVTKSFMTNSVFISYGESADLSKIRLIRMTQV